ncbi:hypothetical protein GIB67_025010 [Kingdonia uniflora]|uniref:Pentatricopeptide repeat-containing protein n=1 Tax=Kingdonia uniflora TaxID=39325 RepID=A0A7J7N7P1_9MAGN|nr:hypothetical protein GIB67_025010 [Kingdonia uniflora]
MELVLEESDVGNWVYKGEGAANIVLGGYNGSNPHFVGKVYAEKQLTKKALFAFDNMGKLGCSSSLKSCNCLLSNLVRNGGSHVASYVYDQMVRVGIVPYVFTITIKVNANCKDGRVWRAMEFVNYMDYCGFELNVVAYNALIGGYADLRDMEGVSRVLKLMSERRITNDVVAYTLLIKGCCKLGRVSEAEKVLHGMTEKTSFVVDEHAYGVLVDGYCLIGSMDNALRVRDELLNAFCKEDRVEGISASVEMYNLLIGGVFKCKRSSKVNNLLVMLRSYETKGLFADDFWGIGNGNHGVYGDDFFVDDLLDFSNGELEEEDLSITNFSSLRDDYELFDEMPLRGFSLAFSWLKYNGDGIDIGV